MRLSGRWEVEPIVSGYSICKAGSHPLISLSLTFPQRVHTHDLVFQSMVWAGLKTATFSTAVKLLWLRRPSVKGSFSKTFRELSNRYLRVTYIANKASYYLRANVALSWKPVSTVKNRLVTDMTCLTLRTAFALFFLFYFYFIFFFFNIIIFFFFFFLLFFFFFFGFFFLFFFFFFFLIRVLRSFQEYFTYIEAVVHQR